MATDQEVQDAEKNRLDNVELAAARTLLSDLHANGSDFQIGINATDGTPINLQTIIAALKTPANDAAIVQLLADIDVAVKALIGADDITVGTLRKAIKDTEDAFDANILAT